MHVLSINSQVCYGHVGAQAMLLPLQLMGHEVTHVPTVLYSNHPGHPGFRGAAVDEARFADLLQGLRDGGFLARMEALHTGYLGSAGIARQAASAAADLLAANPAATYLCDPVLGDDGRLYVDEGIAEVVRASLLPAATILTPNRFELSLLAGRPVDSLEAVVAAARELIEAGPDWIVCTSAVVSADHLDVLTVGRDGAWLTRTAALPTAPKGTGDCFAGVLLGRVLGGTALPEAAAAPAASLDGLIRVSTERGMDELAVVVAQEEFLKPTARLQVEAFG